jgi:hypothetical protein
MGRNARPAEEYRDDPDAVSLHTTPDDYTYDDAPEITGLPPSYADSEGDNAPLVPAHPPAIRHQPPPTGLPRMDHENAYTMTRGKPKVFETYDMMDTRYDTDPEYLEQGIDDMVKVPPTPLIYIIGTHKETTRNGDKKETKEITDFRIVLNLQDYIWPSAWEEGHDIPMRFSTVTNGEKTYRGTILKKRAPGFKQDIEIGSEAPTLREWCHRYCASPSRLRIFRIRKEVVGMDETYLKNRIDGIIRSTGYRGRLNITFPVENRNIDIYTTNKINEWRLKKWICWIFYLTFLWIFTWPYLFFATKRYAVVKAEWLFSTEENGVKKYATVSEEQWFDRWHVAIRRLALDRFQGEPSYQQMQGIIDRPADPPIPGRINTGNATVNNAVGLLQQGFQVASAISRGDPLGRGLQEGWGYDN